MESEEDEPDTDAAANRSAVTLKPKTLNEDPYNATWMKRRHLLARNQMLHVLNIYLHLAEMSV